MSSSETERQRRCDRAATSWPELSIDRAALAEYLDACADEPMSDAGLREVALAFAVSRGDASAIELFETRYLSLVPAAIAHMKLDASAVDDVRQAVREKLVVSEHPPCKLEQYAGQGRLEGLVRVVAVRSALTWIRKHRKELAAATDELAGLPARATDPELAYIKQRYRSEFKAAFGAAIEALSDRERNLVRLHLLGGVTLDALADMYNVHRATITRWLAKARKRVLDHTTKAVRRTLEVEASELDQMMDLIRSRIDLSISRVLGRA